MSAGRQRLTGAIGLVLCLFTVAEVNYSMLGPQSRLALFMLFALLLCFLGRPAASTLRRVTDGVFAAAAAACCVYVVVQTEPWTDSLWLAGTSLGNRAGQETRLDTAVGLVGLVIVLEATRRTIGWALPLLALAFLAYARFGSLMPDALFPHRGYGVERIVAQTFLHSQGVFGTALSVMFTYVFLFVLFGAFLQATGATGFILGFARRVFRGSSGGPAKVAVLSSGLMGSLSGSAVANTATTGTFTIPMMRSAGFRPEIAGGVEAAASSGGALVPPVMGAGAYMMLELVEPQVTYMQIVRAALLPAIVYYLSLLLIVHFHAKRSGIEREGELPPATGAYSAAQGVVFVVGFAVLLAALFAGYTVFRAATLGLAAVLATSVFRPETRLSGKRFLEALTGAARDAIPLVTAAGCVGIVIGVVTLTGVGTKLPSAILGVAEGSLLVALAMIMASSILLGMGLPSAVCYLLMATLVGPVLGQLGVVPLAAHLFIFYFGMMSMVTPPVALAAYAAGSIAGAGIMKTGMAAFRFALVGFTLPYMFVYRPELLMLDAEGGTAEWTAIATAFAFAVLGVIPLAAAIAGHLRGPLGPVARAVLLVSAGLLLVPSGPLVSGAGVALLLGSSLRRTFLR